MRLGSVRRREGSAALKGSGIGKSWMRGNYGEWKFFAMFVFPLLA